MSEKVKSYLIWCGIMMFFASLIQVFIYASFAILKPNQFLLIAMSIFDWTLFTIATHVWARDDPRGSKSPSLDQAIGITKQFGTNKKCSECGSELIFDHTSNRGTTVEFRADNLPNPRKVSQRIIRNAKMSFLWVYFKCPKCGWGLCTTSESKGVFIVKSDEGKKV